MRRSLLTVACATFILAASGAQVAAQPRDRDRPIRVGNLNVAFVGGGYGQHDHPTFDKNGFINIGYQRRILRREVRIIPLWVRGAVNFTSEERDLQETYTYWNDPQAGRLAGVESVQERTSDFTVRLEAMADLLHTRRSALYAGAGFAIHTVHFRSRGLTSGRQGASGLKKTENTMAPSAVLGGRVFMATQPYTAYAEVRFGRTYGRAEGTQDLAPPNQSPPAVGAFELESVANVSIEGGVALHW